MPTEQDYFEANRQLWNDKTPVHYHSDFYDMPAFLAGKTSLQQIEMEQLGDVQGQKILHLQCHFGQDSLSLARMGAEVVGVDFSDKAIETARQLNEQLGLNARFIQSNVYELKSHLDEQFDLVFTSYGTIGWLPDLDRWAEIVAHFLKPGGVFHFVEFHPVVWLFDENFERFKFSYFNSGPDIEEIEGTYADRQAAIGGQSVSWSHSIGEILTALLTQNLQLEKFQEFDYSPYDCFNKTVKIGERRWQIQGLQGIVPMVFALQARKHN